jgi:peptidoglycan/xylan/chitin deacetylase (PgdA/CDA1 family)
MIIPAALLLAIALPGFADTLDAFATGDDALPPDMLDGGTVIDAFSETVESRPFPIPEVVFDSYSLGEEVYPELFVGPSAGGSDTLDALARSGDELVKYKYTSGFGLEGGYGYGPKRVIILMYHRVMYSPRNRYEVSVDSFRWQMEMIRDKGFEVISLYHFAEALRQHNPDLVPEKAVIITIDDGYDYIYDLAWPILREYDYPFTFYFYTQYTGGSGHSMTWEQIREMNDDPLCTIGSHSMTHPNLANPKKAVGDYNSWLWRELHSSKVILENKLDTEIVDFCWPYGSFNHHTMEVGIRAGYQTFTTVAPGPNDMSSSPYRLLRYGIYWHCSRELFSRILGGKRITDEDWEYVRYDAAGEDEFLIP